MKKLYCGVLMWIIFSADCFAMTFSQPIQIGKIIYAPANGIQVENATYAITPTFKIPINFEMFQAYTKFLKNIFGFIVDGVIPINPLVKFKI